MTLNWTLECKNISKFIYSVCSKTTANNFLLLLRLAFYFKLHKVLFERNLANSVEAKSNTLFCTKSFKHICRFLSATDKRPLAESEL